MYTASFNIKYLHYISTVWIYVVHVSLTADNISFPTQHSHTLVFVMGTYCAYCGLRNEYIQSADSS